MPNTEENVKCRRTIAALGKEIQVFNNAVSTT